MWSLKLGCPFQHSILSFPSMSYTIRGLSDRAASGDLRSTSTDSVASFFSEVGIDVQRRQVKLVMFNVHIQSKLL